MQIRASWNKQFIPKGKIWLRPGLFLFLLLFMVGCSQPDRAVEEHQVPGGNASRGRRALANYGCRNCHTIPGVPGADTAVGPPLTDWGGRQYIAGSLDNNSDNLVRWIRFPQSLEPGTAMPDLNVDQQHALDMAAYLYTLRSRQPLDQFVFSVSSWIDNRRSPPPFPETEPPAIEEPQLAPEVQQFLSGKLIYDRYCASCHGQDGSGVRGTVSPLRSNPIVTAADPQGALEAILGAHPVRVGAIRNLSSEDLAAAVSFVRQAWTNQAGPVTAGQVETVRQQLGIPSSGGDTDES